MHLASNGTVPGAVANDSFHLDRQFVATSSQYGAGSTVALAGGAFAAGVGFNCVTVASVRPIFGMSDPSDITKYNWYLRKENATADLKFTTLRASGSGTNDVTMASVLTEGPDYNAIVEWDSDEMRLTLDGETATGAAEGAFGMFAADKTFHLGRVNYSGTAANNFHDGGIAYAWLHAGPITARQREIISKSTKADWREVLYQRQGIKAFGDSLTADDPYPSFATALGLDFGGWPVENHGIGGEASPAILARLQQHTEIKRRICVIGMGNVDTASTSQAIADIAAGRTHALARGAEWVLIVGVTKREAAIAIADVNTINTASAALAAANPTNTLYFDLQDFYINTYVSRATGFGGGTTIADDDADKAANIVPRSAKDVAGDATKTHMNATAVAESSAACYAAISSNF